MCENAILTKSFNGTTLSESSDTPKWKQLRRDTLSDFTDE